MHAGEIAYEGVEGVELRVVVRGDVHAVALGEGPAHHAAEAQVYIGLGVGLAVKIHVEAGGDAAAQILEHGQLGEGVHPLGVEFVLQGEDLLIEPAQQGQVVGVGAEKGHGGVRVRVLEAGDYQRAAEVYLPLKVRHGAVRRAHVGDFVRVRPDLAGKTAAAPVVHRHDEGVIKPYQKITSLSLIPKRLSPPGRLVNCKSAAACYHVRMRRR